MWAAEESSQFIVNQRMHPSPRIGFHPVGQSTRPTHQIHLLIEVIGSKECTDDGNRVARWGKRG
jgi:hypothetical protein